MLSTLKGKIVAVASVVVVAAASFSVGSGWMGAEQVSADPILYNESTVTSIYDTVSPAVVEIETTQASNSFFGSSLVQGQGSGIVIDDQGNILTNNHVIEGASSVKVKINETTTVDGQVKGVDTVKDLAIVKVDASAVAGITPLSFADTSNLKIGQMAIAIGNPYGLEDTITVGVISGLNRTIGDLSGMIQTDASLNPGNSGGPLLDANGAVIGINTAIETGTNGSATGIGFAVPSSVITSELDQLKAGVTIATPWLGISGRTLTSDLASELELNIEKGVLVASVVSGSPAASAGLKASANGSNGQLTTAGDVITKIDGQTTDTIESLQTYIRSKNSGDSVVLTVVRDGNTITVNATLADKPAEVVLNSSDDNSDEDGNSSPMPRMPGRGWFNFDENSGK